MLSDDHTLLELGNAAIDLAVGNVMNGGGPFGAIIVRNGEVIARGINNVTISNDPTAHAEVVAIRQACTMVNNFQLQDCILITSCEPCPMCLGAIYWARIKAVYFVASQHDAAAAGFDDSFIYKELETSHEDRKIPFIRLELSNSTAPFEAWSKMGDKTLY